jgi:hypothetical protein
LKKAWALCAAISLCIALLPAPRAGAQESGDPTEVIGGDGEVEEGPGTSVESAEAENPSPPPLPEKEAEEKEEQPEADGEHRAAKNGAESPAVAETKAKESGFSKVAWITFGGGVAAAIMGGGCSALSPCCCGLFFGIPLATLTLGAGGLLAGGVAGDWELKRIWGPTLVALGVGGTSSVVAMGAAIFAAQLVTGVLPPVGVDIDARNTATFTTAAVAGGTAAGVILLGSVVAALGAGWIFDITAPEEPGPGDDDKAALNPEMDPILPAHWAGQKAAPLSVAY